MYTILISDKNELVTTVRERIMQRSKLVDNLHFLTAPEYKGFDMTDFTVTMEFITPISKELKTEILTRSSELYKGMIEYKLAIDTDITKEAGSVELTLSFTRVEMDEFGNVIQRVRKTSATTLEIIPVANWCNVIPDSALSALDQRLIKADAQIKALEEVSNYLNDTKADNLKYDRLNNVLQLLAGNKEIGDKVTLKTCDEGASDNENDDKPYINNVIEF